MRNRTWLSASSLSRLAAWRRTTSSLSACGPAAAAAAAGRMRKGPSGAGVWAWRAAYSGPALRCRESCAHSSGRLIAVRPRGGACAPWPPAPTWIVCWCAAIALRAMASAASTSARGMSSTSGEALGGAPRARHITARGCRQPCCLAQGLVPLRWVRSGVSARRYGAPGAALAVERPFAGVQAGDGR